ncbi:MAG: Sec-independent protein translocase protein TatB [Pseudorhodobacter sp.]|nr:Sec-independent protein translocase protein TatB [Pseudorhodobacter sp.]
MFDIGWTELLLIGIVALIVIGPKDLPDMFRTMGRFTAKAKGMAREFSRAMESAADEAGVKDVAKDLKNVTSAKNMGLNAVKDAATKFEKWDPIKAAKSGVVAPKTAASPDAAGPNTQALAEAQAAKRGALKEAAAAPKAEPAAAAPPPKPAAPPAAEPAPPPKAAPKATSAEAAKPAAAKKPRAPKSSPKKSDA